MNVFCRDQVGLLASLSQCIASNGANCVSANIQSTEDGKATCQFEITVANAQQLDTITRMLDKIDGVLRVEHRKNVPAS